MKFIPFVAILTLAAAPVTAAEPPTTPPDAMALLSRALRGFKNADAWVALIEVKRKPPEAPAPGQGVVRLLWMAGKGRPFEGGLEAWRAADGVMVLVSKATLPGFAIYCDPSRRGHPILRATREAGEEEHAPSSRELVDELLPLLDAARFTRQVIESAQAGKLKATRDPESGDLTLRGVLPIETVDVRRATDGFVSPERVLEVRGTLVIDTRGRFKRILVQVKHNDPAQETIQGHVVRRFRIQVGGGVPQPLPPLPPAGGGGTGRNGAKEKTAPIEGESALYTLVFSEAAPGERAKAFKAEIQALLAQRRAHAAPGSASSEADPHRD